MAHAWIIAAVVYATVQFVPLFAVVLPPAGFDVVYLFASDVAFIALSVFAFAICPWSRVAAKMAAFGFMWWSLVCLVGNAAIKYYAFEQYYTLAGLYALAGVLVAFACMRFLIFKTPEIHIVDDDHLYLIASSPRNLMGALAMAITGIGGGFSIWHPGARTLFKYVRGDKSSMFTRLHQSDAPNHKVFIDMGPATKSRLAYLGSQLGTRWSYFSNCLTKIGAVKYDG